MNTVAYLLLRTATNKAAESRNTFRNAIRHPRFLDVQAQTEHRAERSGLPGSGVFLERRGQFFHMELSEKAAFLFSEPYLWQTTHAFNETHPERMGPRGHGANDPVMAATCGRAWLPQWAS